MTNEAFAETAVEGPGLPEGTSVLYDRARRIADDLDPARLAAARLTRRRDEYFLNISYPSLQAMKPVRASDIYEHVGRPGRTMALYVHVPFCRALCSYCHYFKTFRAPASAVDRYLDLIASELSLHRRNLGRITAASLYVGGGTPSYLSPAQVERLFGMLRKDLVIPPTCEVSFEVHPENATSPLFVALRDMGVNRVSIGVESLDDVVLGNEQRRHTAADALRAYELAIRSGCENVNLDFIYGLRGQTVASWEATLDAVGALSPASVCAYYLRLKQGTPEYKRYLRHPEHFPSERDLLVMHIMTFEAMADFGYRQEIVDWFIRHPKYFHVYQQHNWQRTDDIELLGLGPSAYSYVNGYQYYNTVDINAYAAHLERGELPIWKGERLSSVEERMRRSILLGLKARIDRAAFRRTYGVDIVAAFPETVAHLEDLGVVEVEDQGVSLTYTGKLFADEVGRQFYSPEMRARMEAVEPSLISTTLPQLNLG